MPHLFSNSNKITAKYFKVSPIQVLHKKETRNFSRSSEEGRSDEGDGGLHLWPSSREPFARVEGLQPSAWPSAPPLCLPAPQHSPCSAHGFSSQFPFPPGVAPSSAAHLRSSQATWEVGVGAVVGLPG